MKASYDELEDMYAELYRGASGDGDSEPRDCEGAVSHHLDPKSLHQPLHGSLCSIIAACERAHHLSDAASLAFEVLAEPKLDITGHQGLAATLQTSTALAYNGLPVRHTATKKLQARAKKRRTFVTHAQRVRHIAQQMPHLQQLEITCAHLDEAFVRALTEGLKETPLTTLILHDCHLETACLKLLLDAFLPTLRRLDLSFNDFHDHGVGAIDLSRAHALEHLDLSHCHLDLADLNISECHALRHINLSSNGGGASFLMGHDFSAMPHLHTIQLNRSQLQEGCLHHLELSGNPALRFLDIGYNALADRDIMALSLAMPAQMVGLNVAGNRCGAKSFLALQRMGFSGLQSLYFSDNTLADYAQLAGSPPPTLAVWPKLQMLDLAGCQPLGRMAVTALGLAEAKDLRWLDLSSAWLSDDALAALPWGAFESLDHLIIDDNPISQAGIERAALDACPTLRRLDIRGHNMTRVEAAQALSTKSFARLVALRARSAESLRERAAPAPEVVQSVRARMAQGATVEL